MASKKRNKERRRTRRPAPAADTATPDRPEETPAEPAGKANVGAFGRWADRLEQTVDERPPAPWGNFPLGPLSVLAGLVLVVVGAIGSNPAQLGIGLALGSLGGLELSIREHFAGFRSHTTLLAGFLFVITVGLAYYVGTIVLWACLLIGVALAVPAFWLLRKHFEKASGGLSYKIK